MAVVGRLIDKSALVRLADSPDAEEWAARIERGRVRITTATLLEVAYSARTAAQARSVFRTPPISAMPVEYFTPAVEDRASDVQVILAGKGKYRAPSIPGLIIAVAELVGLTVLHVDKDFELIARLTGQPVERLTT